MQPQAVSVYNPSLYTANSWYIFVSTDVALDLSAGLDPVQAITWVLCEHSNIDPHTAHLWTQTGLVTSFSCDLEPDMTKPTPRKTVVSADPAPDI